MDLTQLEYVVQVATHRHFSRAAEEICIAQSSLSQQIAKLETELGVKLFNRTTRTVQLTAAGAEFILHARKILAEIEAARQSMQAHVGLTKGTVNLGAITTLESINFVSLITTFHKKYPGLHLNISQNGSYKLTEMLRAAAINAAILTPPTNIVSDDIEYYKLAEDEFVLVTSPDHPFAGKPVLDLAEARGENYVFPSPDQSIYNIYYQACLDAGFSPNIVCQCSHSETSLALVSQGMGIGLFPLEAVKVPTPYPVSYCHLNKPIKKLIALALLKNTYQPPAVRVFCEYVLAATARSR
ncbi:MAG: LysR family transcriptional regulator [Negativicutes bacterium]|nr:LysR family transcriptional regulator [Negativicutes bacterium]